jgi:hypothetical protein
VALRWRVFPGWHFERSTTFKKTKETGVVCAGLLECAKNKAFSLKKTKNTKNTNPHPRALVPPRVPARRRAPVP